VLGSDDSTLRADAATFADELRLLSGQMLPLVEGGAVQAGDIELDLQANEEQLGDEGYKLSVGPGIAISANAPAKPAHPNAPHEPK